jgi:hypothetical protein
LEFVRPIVYVMSDTPPPVPGHIVHALRKAADAVEQQLARTTGLSAGEVAVVSYLAVDQPATIPSVAAGVGHGYRGAQDTLADLRRAGLVMRWQSGLAKFALSDAGNALAAQMTAAVWDTISSAHGWPVVHANPREDRRQIGTKIKDALKALNQWPDGSEVDQIRDWLARAQLALEKRNAFLHSVPLVLFDEHFRKIGDAVGEMPRGDRAYYLRRMDVDEVQKVRAVLDAAQEGWEETEMFAYELHPK